MTCYMQFRGVGKGGSKGAVAPLDLETIHCFSMCSTLVI